MNQNTNFTIQRWPPCNCASYKPCDSPRTKGCTHPHQSRNSITTQRIDIYKSWENKFSVLYGTIVFVNIRSLFLHKKVASISIKRGGFIWHRKQIYLFILLITTQHYDRFDYSIVWVHSGLSTFRLRVFGFQNFFMWVITLSLKVFLCAAALTVLRKSDKLFPMSIALHRRLSRIIFYNIS